MYWRKRERRKDERGEVLPTISGLGGGASHGIGEEGDVELGSMERGDAV